MLSKTHAYNNNPSASYHGIDLLKFLMALCVIAIHTDSVCHAHYPLSIEWLIRLAVPFFFVTSGFLMARKLDAAASIDDKRHILNRRAKHLLRLFGLWLLIYLPISVICFADDGTPALSAIINYIVRVILFGESSYAYALWFLYSMAVCTWLLSLSMKWRRGTVILGAIFVAVYLLKFFVDKYDLMSSLGIMSYGVMSGDRLLGGGIYILSGMIFFHRDKISKLPAWLGPLILTASFVLCYLQLPLYQPLGGIALCIIGLRLSLGGNGVWMYLRNMSMWIYYLHMIFVYILHVNTTMSVGYFYISATTSTIAMSALLMWLRRYPVLSKIDCLIR